MNLVLFLLAFYISIAAHEFGHYLSSKTFGVGVPTFCIGFGPTLFRFNASNTNFKFKLIPLGGYINNNPNELSSISIFKEWIIILSGVLVNFILLTASLSLFFNKSIPTVISILFTQILGPVASAYINPTSYFGANIALSSTVPSMLNNFTPNNFLLVLGAINLALFAFNLLPLPVLDGGQLYMSIARRVSNKLPKYTNKINKILSILIILSWILLLSPLFINELLRFASPLQLTLYTIIGILITLLIRVVKQTDLYKTIVKAKVE